MQTSEHHSNESAAERKTARNSPRLFNSQKERIENGGNFIEWSHEHVLTAGGPVAKADSTQRVTADLQSESLAVNCIADLKQMMEIEERSSMGNTNASFDGDKSGTEQKRARRTRSRHTSMLERLAPTPGYVDKTSVDVEGGSLAQRRTPRMASLNAAAKVNVFFEPSSPLAGRSLCEIQQHSNTGKRQPSRTSTDRRHSDRAENNNFRTDEYADLDVFVQGEVTSTCDALRSKDVISPNEFDNPEKVESNAHGNCDFYTNGHRGGKDKRKPEADSTSEDERNVKRIHLIGESGCFDGNGEELSGLDEGEMECDTTTDSPPKTMVDVCIQVDLPRPPVKHVRVLSVPIKGQLVTSGGAVPFTKSHLVTPVTPSKPPPELKVSKTATTKRTVGLNNQAMENVFVANDGPLAKFKAVGGLMDERSKAKKAKELTNKISTTCPANVTLKIPKINFAATSTSTMSAGRGRPAGNPLKNVHLKNLSVQLEKLAAERARAEPRMPKRTNGWMFIGEPLDKPYCYDETIVIRRYYSGVQRGDEIINVRDSVLLKSGTRKKDPPFVARVSGLWEEDEGPNAGEMMMSVFWYYRPEQTEVGRIPNFHGDVEVMASRHKDDNSVACIVDKCYVLSYPEYCRFRALNRLFREFREAPMSPVPPGESTKPGSVPHPRTDPNLVFFCRQVYDYRMGRIIKNPV